MEYRSLLSSYGDNLNIKDQDATFFRKAKQDLVTVLSQMYRLSQAPVTSYIIPDIVESVTFAEDFADTTLIAGFTNKSGFILEGESLRIRPISSGTGIGTGIFEQTIADNLVSMEITGAWNLDVINSASITLLIEVLDGTSNILYTETITISSENIAIENSSGYGSAYGYGYGGVTGSEALGTFTYNFAPDKPLRVPGEGGTIRVTVTIPQGWKYLDVSNFTFITDKSRYLMPENFVYPLDIVFRDSSGNVLASDELKWETFNRWNPFTFSSDTGSLVVDTDSIRKVYTTDENLQYDGKIGYTFRPLKGQTYLHIKPPFTGSAEISYSYMPTVTGIDQSQVEFNKIFFDVVLSGMLTEALLRMIQQADNEIKLNALTIAMRKYSARYDKGLTEFIGFMNYDATPKRILPFDFLNDFDMLRQ